MGKRSEFIIIIIYHVHTIANVAAMCAIVIIMIARTHFSSLRHAQCARYWIGRILVPEPMARWQHVE